jgi:hypothetical protein
VGVAFADRVGEEVLAWKLDHPEATLEQMAEAWRTIPMEVALEVCGKRERKDVGWFAEHKTMLMRLVARRNLMELEWRKQKKSGEQAAAKAKLQQARRELKRGAKEARLKFLADQVENTKGGARNYWECVAAIRGCDAKGTAVAVQNFLDSDGIQCKNPEENATVATAHFTKVYNIHRERPQGSDEAVSGVRQRAVRVGLDDPITVEEFTKVLSSAKKGKATSNQVPIEVLEATRSNAATLGLLFQYTSDVFEEGRVTNHPAPLPPPEPPPPLRPPAETSKEQQMNEERRQLIAGAKAGDASGSKRTQRGGRQRTDTISTAQQRRMLKPSGSGPNQRT